MKIYVTIVGESYEPSDIKYVGLSLEKAKDLAQKLLNTETEHLDFAYVQLWEDEVLIVERFWEADFLDEDK